MTKRKWTSSSTSSFFERALGDFQVVTQSAVFADADGGIGFVVTGRIPVRRTDNDLRGIAPAPGWDARYDWEGYVPYTEVPRSLDPESGFIATAWDASGHVGANARKPRRPNRSGTSAHNASSTRNPWTNTTGRPSSGPATR